MKQLNNSARRTVSALFAVLTLTMILSGAAQAATLTVDNTTDDAALAACTAEAGDCSLRGAIAVAAAGDTITSDSVSLMTARSIRLTNGFLIINKDLTVADVGVIVDANRGVGAFFVQSGTVNISGITVTGVNGDSAADASGIANQGTLTLTSMVITSNNSAQGGGILNQGTLNVVNSTISDNSAAEGGGIYSGDGRTLNVTGSTISNNTSHYSGAGIHLGMYASSAITNLVVQNSAYFHAGILSRFGTTLNITNSTVSGNRANAQYGIVGGIAACLGTWTNVTVANNSGGVYTCGAGDVIGRNSLFAGNGNDVRGQINSQGSNLVQNRGTSSGYVSTDLPDGTNPLLGALANNGGLSPTHALLPNSPTINAGNNAFWKFSHVQ